MKVLAFKAAGNIYIKCEPLRDPLTFELAMNTNVPKSSDYSRIETHIRAIITCLFTEMVTLLCYCSVMSFISPLILFMLIFCLKKLIRKL